jgi:hypothetical protein
VPQEARLRCRLQEPSTGASWRIRRHPRAAPLDKEEPRSGERRSWLGSSLSGARPYDRSSQRANLLNNSSMSSTGWGLLGS